MDKRPYFPQKPWLLLVGLLVLGIVSVVSALKYGTVPIAFSHFLHLTPLESEVVWAIRLPRLLTAFIVGAFLATAGISFQGILRNPLADPYILGVSAGAGLGVAIGVILNWPTAFSGVLGIYGLIGAFVSILLVNAIVKAAKGTRITHFIFAGIIINAFFSAMTMLILFLAGPKMQSIIFWLMGDCSKTSWGIILISAGLGIPFLGFLWGTSHYLNLVAASEHTALVMGVRVGLFRLWVILAASCLTGITVALGGVIGFVGLVVPHILRLLLADDFRILIPFSFLAGGIFLVIADTIARSAFVSTELPVGVLTAFIGAPFFLYIFLRYSR